MVFVWVLYLDALYPNFTITHIKNKIFNTIKKLKVHVPYVDDIFIATRSYDEINKLKQILEKNSELKFTTKLIINKENSLLKCSY